MFARGSKFGRGRPTRARAAQAINGVMKASKTSAQFVSRCDQNMFQRLRLATSGNARSQVTLLFCPSLQSKTITGLNLTLKAKDVPSLTNITLTLPYSDQSPSPRAHVARGNRRCLKHEATIRAATHRA